MVPGARRISYDAGAPVPSFTSVNVRLTEESVAADVARSDTALGAAVVVPLLTVMEAVPLAPALEAVTVADPLPTPVATPEALTFTTEVSFEVHVTIAPVMTCP